MRALRILLEGAVYHVTSQIDHGAMALSGAEIKQMFLDFVEKAKKKFGFELWNFTVMDNHIHFLIKPGKEASLSKIMQWIKCNFAKKWNKAHDTKGHLWGERFHSRIIKDENDLVRTSKYIDENPVKAKLVKEAKDWKFGGLFHKIRGIIGLIDKILDGELGSPSLSGLSVSASPG
ncbi:MAG: transposase [Spirochaetaceae bacterium]|jgi:REP element-mobilizing transposase RayT|nr:transposase [Spirochaetaceae bacterium]